MGISLDPCALGARGPNWIAAMTSAAGYFPPLRWASIVRSGGVTFSAGVAGLDPFASFPWQTAQYAANISFPEVGDALAMGVFFIVAWFCCLATKVRVRNSIANKRVSIKDFRFLMIDLPFRFPSGFASGVPTVSRLVDPSVLAFTLKVRLPRRRKNWNSPSRRASALLLF